MGNAVFLSQRQFWCKLSLFVDRLHDLTEGSQLSLNKVTENQKRKQITTKYISLSLLSVSAELL